MMEMMTEVDMPRKRDWTIVPLGSVAKAASGIGFAKELQGLEDGEFPVFKVGDISTGWLKGDKYLEESVHNLTLALVKQLKGKPLPAGTTVFAKIGEGLKP
ncbi:MAG: hypothetical protein LKM36_11975 [Flavobacteriales bacterium]|jgi:type I restriction enzyme S subunit|nr:hypothetical protein [Flavobacteriales bacterium]